MDVALSTAQYSIGRVDCSIVFSISLFPFSPQKQKVRMRLTQTTAGHVISHVHPLMR